MSSLARKKILFLTSRVPFPPNKGDKIRTYHVLRHLTARHDVFCACFCDTLNDNQYVGELRSICRDVLVVPWGKSSLIRGAWNLARGGTVTLGAFSSHAMMEKIVSWGRFDAAYAFSGAMAPFALATNAGRRMLDLCDVDSEKYFDYARDARFPMSQFYRCEGERLRGHELNWLEHFDASVVITDRERRVIDANRSKLHVIPNGVHLQLDSPLPSIAPASCSFIGAMDYPPNIDAVSWFASEIWPHVFRQHRQARFRIVGRNPARQVRQLEKLPGVLVCGEVPDVTPHLLMSRVIVAPLRIARGLPNKVLEAMAARRPVVTTPQVAAALHAGDGQELLVAEDAAEFSARVIELLETPRLCDDIGEAGFEFVRRNHDWAILADRFEALLLGPQAPSQGHAQNLPQPHFTLRYSRRRP